MKGGREEEKIMGPLFPRLHVNDTDKRGPRAPPRNKMALYEQLSIPSQRFSSSVASSLALPPHRGSTLTPSGSLSKGCGHERSVVPPFYVPYHAPANSAKCVHSHSSNGTNLNNSRKESERRSKKHMNNSTCNARGSVSESSSVRPHDSSTVKNFSGKNFDDEDDFRVPSFVQSEVARISNEFSPTIEPPKQSPVRANNTQNGCSGTFNSSRQFLNSNDKPLEQTSTYDMTLIICERNHGKKTSVFKDSAKLSESHLESGKRSVEPSNFAKTSSDQDQRGIKDSCNGNAEFFPKACGKDALGGPRNLNGIDAAENENSIRTRNESCSKASLGNSHCSTADKGNRENDDKTNGSLEWGDAYRNDEGSDDSMVDSQSGLEISPDDVVGVIGTKHFWKARRAIVNQQRVFAVQVFELHRLIKVQKLIATSPDVLIGNHYLSQTPPKVSSKCLPPQHMAISHLQTQKLEKNNERLKQSTVEDPPFPSNEDNINNGPPVQIPKTMPCSGNLPLGPTASGNQPNPWCFQQPPNQWLVPVMSPSEGLIYKPYSGHCPPTASFMAPIYGSYTPLGFPPVAGDFMNSAYCIPSSHQQQHMGLRPSYFPSPRVLPAGNPVISSSAVDQVNPLNRFGPNGQHSRNSCNVSNLRSEAFSSHRRKFQASKHSEVQGSTASSPEKAKGGDALPLFPMAPATESSGEDKLSTRVIRVVPHNARSATESAARIFRSIQEERQQYDS